MDHYRFEDEMAQEDKEKAKAESLRVSKMIKDTFSTPMGRDCMEYLEKHFVTNRHLVNPSYEDMHNNMELGKRDLVLFLKEQIQKDV